MDKQKFRKTINLLTVLMCCCIIYSVLAIVFYWHSRDYGVLTSLLLFLLLPMIFAFCHALFDNIIIFTIIHLLSLGIVYKLISADKFTFIILGILSVVFVIFSFYKKFDVVLPKPYELGVLPAIAIVVTYLLSLLLKSRLVSAVITFSFICYMFLYLINHYFINVHNFYDSTACTSVGSFDKARVALNKIVFGFSTISVILMAIFSILPNANVSGDISKAFHYVISKLLRSIKDFIPSSSDTTSTSSTALPSEAPGSTTKPTFVPNTASTSTSHTLEYIVLGIVIFLIVLGLFFLIRLLFSALNRTTAPVQTDITNFIKPFDNEKKLKNDRAFLKRVADRFGQSNEQKIRKIFYTTIIDNVDERLIYNNSFTPTQLCDLTYEEINKDALNEMKQIYFKARYSNVDCTLSDLNTMKELQKKCKVEYQTDYTYKRG